MEIVRQVFDTSLTMVASLWNTCLNSWGIFGGFVISYAILRKIGRTFNRLKS